MLNLRSALLGSALLFQLLVLAGASHDASTNLRRKIQEDDEQKGFNLPFDMFMGYNEGLQLGQRCGRRNQCLEGLDCVAPAGIGWKMCLPITCIQRVTDDYNQPQDDKDTTPFEDFANNVMTGAGLSPTLFDEHREGEIMDENITMLGPGEMVEKQNFLHIIKDNVRDALTSSVIREHRKGNMVPLHQSVEECFAPFMGGEVQDGDGRRLQNTGFTCADGFFLEAAGIAQFIYGQVVYDENSTSVNSTTVNDYCVGAGPVVGVGGGYLLQLWWVSSTADAEPGSANMTLPEMIDSITAQGSRFLENAAFMIDLDGTALGGAGIAFNTVQDGGFSINRLWIKVGAGGGGGLALSACFVELVSDDIP